jgi:hypothetical protein
LNETLEDDDGDDDDEDVDDVVGDCDVVTVLICGLGVVGFNPLATYPDRVRVGGTNGGTRPDAIVDDDVFDILGH